jgi:hypothetical protein
MPPALSFNSPEMCEWFVSAGASLEGGAILLVVEKAFLHASAQNGLAGLLIEPP